MQMLEKDDANEEQDNNYFSPQRLKASGVGPISMKLKKSDLIPHGQGAA